MFAEMPLDNRTVVKFAAGVTASGFAGTFLAVRNIAACGTV
jgi:hypothetical protein